MCWQDLFDSVAHAALGMNMYHKTLGGGKFCAKAYKIECIRLHMTLIAFAKY